jgi:outer membrane protein assembly factor BamA
MALLVCPLIFIANAIQLSNEQILDCAYERTMGKPYTRRLVHGQNESKLSAGAYYDKALIDKAEQELKRQYLTRGYYAADVATTISPIDRNCVGVLFSVVEGPSAKIRQINFVGNHMFDDRTLNDKM